MRIRHLAIAGLVLALALSFVALTGCPKKADTNVPPPPDVPPPAPGDMPEPTDAGPATGETIRQIGSTTVLPLAEKWHTAFMEAHPEANIAVSGGGSGSGIEALISGTAEIANASRPIKDKETKQAEEAGINVVEHVVAFDGIAVIVHPSNGAGQLSVEQISDIFVGNITNWNEVGGSDAEIVIVSRDSASGTYEAFKELVVTLHKTDKERDYAASALKESSNQAVLTAVAQTETAIGYVGLGYLDDSVKALDVVAMGGGDAVAASVDNVKSGDYPVSRSLFCYTNGEPAGVLKDYMDFCMSDEGQQIVADEGFVPVK